MTLDLDSLPHEVFGHQPGSEWNGHCRVRCYHPLVVRSEFGDFLAACDPADCFIPRLSLSRRKRRSTLRAAGERSANGDQLPVSSPVMFLLRLLGGASLEGENGPITGPAGQRRRLALLALLTVSHPRAIPREKLLAFLWPERDTEHARKLLNQAVHTLRRELGEEAILSAGEELRLGADTLGADVLDFEAALAAGKTERAVQLYSGPFLDGFFLPASPEFERWVDRERERLAGAYAKTLEALAEMAEAQGDLPGAVEWWKVRAAQDPYDSRVALRVMQALATSGNRAGALQHATVHERLLQEELGFGPVPEVAALAERLRSEPVAGAPASSRPTGTPDRREPQPSDPPSEEPRGSPPLDSGPLRPTHSSSPPTVQRATPHRPRWPIGAALLAIVAILAAFWFARTRDSGPERSIVVLPFLDLSPDADNEYFSDGLTEEIITRLASVPELKVISRTSAMHYKGSEKSLRQIAAELNVAHILEGSVRQSDRRLRISAQLIDARADNHLWAENYDYELGDLFRVQEEIAREVVGALEVELGQRGLRRLARHGTRDPEAYEFYRRGRFLWSTRTREAHEQAIEYFRRAIDRDSSYADAYAGLADAYLTSYQNNVSNLPEAEVYSRLKWAAERALALDDESADARASFAVALWWQRNWPGAERELLRALELNPSDANARGWYAMLLGGMDRVEEALQQGRRAYELDPFAVIVSMTYAWACRIARDDDCAIEQYRRALEINSSWAPAYAGLGLVYAQKGMHRAAIREVSKAVELRPRSSEWLADLAFVQALAGEMGDARESLQRAKSQSWEAFHVARAYVALGEPDSAFVWLERSSWQWPHRAARADPALDPLRSDPRFAQLTAWVDREMGLQ